MVKKIPILVLLAFFLLGSVVLAEPLPTRIIEREQLKKGGSVRPLRAPRYVLLQVNAVLADRDAKITKLNVEDTLRALLPRIRKDAEHRKIRFDGITADLYKSYHDIRDDKSPLGRIEWWPKGHSFKIENDENILDKSTYVETVKIYALPEKASVVTKRLAVMDRREIFSSLVRAKERAIREAEELSPADVTKMSIEKLRTYDLTWARKKNAKELKRLLRKYRLEIMNRHGVLETELDVILKEGVKGDWPLLPQ